MSSVHNCFSRCCPIASGFDEIGIRNENDFVLSMRSANTDIGSGDKMVHVGMFMIRVAPVKRGGLMINDEREGVQCQY